MNSQVLFAERLKQLMEESHMTQKELAERARITDAALSRYINAIRLPRMEIVSNLATVLNTTTDYLLGHAAQSDAEWNFCGIKRLVARSADALTHEQKMQLIDIIVGKDR